ncbi:AciT family ciprofloxacin tolerance protein [Acinetobacter sp. HY1485]|uniref:AciT family ciprofloxacin tolerance protein n=1 Tax=Acinetobacter sp. HY1485 TaxID=2970918 RepID=UPI0022B94615|nr:AciT family ciprofloxacin tolerance protein [Acinetobacter sp. HY1485]
MLTAHFASIVGLSLIGIALVAVFVSPHRHWLSFLAAGMVFWSAVEAIRFGVQFIFELSVINSYLFSVILSLGLMMGLLLYLDKLSQKTAAKRQFIEHTPVCDDEKA